MSSSNAPVDAVVLTGSGRYADPWHPFAATSTLLMTWLRELRPDIPLVERFDIDAELSGWGVGAALPTLLIANFGLPRDGARSPLDAAATAGLQRFLRENVPVIAVHAAVTSLIDTEDWSELIGGRWVRGTSWHPPASEFTVQPTPVASAPVAVPLVGGSATVDERYARLERRSTATVIAEHDVNGVSEPSAWLVDDRDRRAAYVALGHDLRAYTGRPMRELFDAAVAWTLPRTEETHR